MGCNVNVTLKQDACLSSRYRFGILVHSGLAPIKQITRGGGVLPYMHIGYVPRERPPFSTLNSDPEHIIFTNFEKFRSGASPFYSFCRSGDHNFRNFAAHGRLIQPSGASSLQEPRTFTPPRARATWARSVAVHFSRCRGAPGLAAGQNASQTRLSVRSGDPQFHTRAPRARSRIPHFHARAPKDRPGAQHFTLELDQEPPIFHLAVAHTYQNWG